MDFDADSADTSGGGPRCYWSAWRYGVCMAWRGQHALVQLVPHVDEASERLRQTAPRHEEIHQVNPFQFLEPKVNASLERFHVFLTFIVLRQLLCCVFASIIMSNSFARRARRWWNYACVASFPHR